MNIEEKYMHRCLELATSGAGHTEPNPMVGAVVVCDGKIIGEGYHRRCGEAHAEVNAIASVKNEELLSKSTIYVSLEPCSHYGKTPPCSELIIRPFPAVSGRGVLMLREAGIEVVTGVLEKEARELNKVFMTVQEKHRPYIRLKWAQSNDGFIDKIRESVEEKPVVFSTPESQVRVHKMRAESAAILVGTNTALLDNPSLNVRKWSGKNPVRMVLDRILKIPQDFHLMDGSIETLVFTEKKAENRENLEYINIDFSGNVIQQILDEMMRRKLHSLLVEGGSNLLSQFIDSSMWDEAWIETANFELGEGVAAPRIS